MAQENTLLQEIYLLNKLLRKYKVNFYYSIKKNGIFILHGWRAQRQLNFAYILTAFGTILFAFTFIYHEAIVAHPLLNNFITILSPVCICFGVFILFDFYSKLKNLQSTVLITKNGISFRNKNEISLWTKQKLKAIEVVNTMNKKQAMKTYQDELKLKKEGKIIAYHQTGETKELMMISNKDRVELKSDLESVRKTILLFLELNNKENPTSKVDSPVNFVKN